MHHFQDATNAELSWPGHKIRVSAEVADTPIEEPMPDGLAKWQSNRRAKIEPAGELTPELATELASGKTVTLKLDVDGTHQVSLRGMPGQPLYSMPF